MLGVFAVSSFAQTGGKIAIINTNDFYLKDKGIKRLQDQYAKLEIEFKTVNDELEALANKAVKLETELKSMQESRSKGVPIDETSFASKVAELDKMKREYQFKSDEAKASFDRREKELVTPVMEDIANKVEDYAKSKQIDMVLDLDKMARVGMLLHLNRTAMDITTAFITYYNALPATAKK